MIEFKDMDGDEPYHEWLSKNQSGFVVNSDKAKVNRNYPRLHFATCSHINDSNTPNYTTVASTWFKLCSASRTELETYVADNDKRELILCKDCERRGL